MVKSLLLIAAGVVVTGGAAGMVMGHGQAQAAGSPPIKAGVRIKSKPNVSAAPKRMWRVRTATIKNLAHALHISTQTLRGDLKAGDTLATLAVKEGSSAGALEATLLSDAKSHLKAAVAGGHLTSAKASRLETTLSPRIDKLVTETPSRFGHGPMHPRPSVLMKGLVRDSATTLHLSAKTLRADLKAGDTLATIAVKEGSSASALEATLSSDAKTAIQGDVTAGKLSSGRAAKIEAHITPWVDRIVNRANRGPHPSTGHA